MLLNQELLTQRLIPMPFDRFGRIASPRFLIPFIINGKKNLNDLIKVCEQIDAAISTQYENHHNIEKMATVYHPCNFGADR
jgi:hypothetical protein